ncbi:hypothetical protein [Pseudodesulfovibrio sp. zrk46]|uniref:hypothetical protein n=1 Tax=Pseudodesulfovibrio sp. zrk46 TaxID=2725288 RepID=UPI0014491915|nr:hypothetical protein [Pseudodesulfovibrio sp. zrk46]QJB55954.1 hypothetical protein HFN16_05810 [Pseudodesulfovibrio sp. zrk46]
MKKLILSVAMLMAFALPAMAGTDYNVCFNSLDADGSDSVSRGEYLVAFPDADQTMFDKADADKDGALSHEEWEEFKESQGYEEGELHG